MWAKHVVGGTKNYSGTMLFSRIDNHPLIALVHPIAGLVIARKFDPPQSWSEEVEAGADIILCDSCWTQWATSVYGAYEGLPRCFHLEGDDPETVDLATFEVDTTSTNEEEVDNGT